MSENEIKFLYLNEEDMIKAGVLDAGRCVDTMKETMSLLSEGDYLMGGKNHNDHGIELMFPKTSEIDDFPLRDARDRRFMAMPAYLGGRFHLVGQKWYGSNGRNASKGLPRSILMVTLNDVETGQPLSHMSANLLSAMRTGSMPGLAAMYLAKKDSKVVSLIGPGVVNKTCLMAYMSKFDSIDTVKVKGSSKTSKTALEMKAFIEEHYPQIKNIVLCDTLEEAVRDADIISEAVSVENRNWPVLEPDWFKPGCVCISSGTMEISDHHFIKDHMTKVVDNIHMYEEYIEVYQEYNKDGTRKSNGTPGMIFCNMVEDGWIKKEDIISLGDIIRGISPARQSEDEMFLVSVGGMPIEDTAWGYECYKKALKEGIGTELELWSKPHLV